MRQRESWAIFWGFVAPINPQSAKQFARANFYEAFAGLIGLVALACFPSSLNAQDLLAGWDFQTTSNGGTAVAVSPATPKVYSANFGTGTLYLDGSNGSSNWFVPATGSTSTELNALAGSTVNTAGTSFSTTTTLGALALLGGASGTAANGKSMIFRFIMTGYKSLLISYSTQRTGTGFSQHVWEVSTDGSTWNPLGTFSAGTTLGTIADTFATSGVLTLPTATALDNASSAYVRVSFSGSTSASGNNRQPASPGAKAMM